MVAGRGVLPPLPDTQKAPARLRTLGRERWRGTGPPECRKVLARSRLSGHGVGGASCVPRVMGSRAKNPRGVGPGSPPSTRSRPWCAPSGPRRAAGARAFRAQFAPWARRWRVGEWELRFRHSGRSGGHSGNRGPPCPTLFPLPFPSLPRCAPCPWPRRTCAPLPRAPVRGAPCSERGKEGVATGPRLRALPGPPATRQGLT